jgi:hypothetical protein
MTPTEIGAIATALVTVLGGAGMLIKDRRSGRLSADEHQRGYIQDQQEDIAALRRDLSQLWAWAVKAVRTAAKEGIELDPLPAEPPQSKTPASGKSG